MVSDPITPGALVAGVVQEKIQHVGRTGYRAEMLKTLATISSTPPSSVMPKLKFRVLVLILVPGPSNVGSSPEQLPAFISLFLKPEDSTPQD